MTKTVKRMPATRQLAAITTSTTGDIDAAAALRGRLAGERPCGVVAARSPPYLTVLAESGPLLLDGHRRPRPRPPPQPSPPGWPARKLLALALGHHRGEALARHPGERLQRVGELGPPDS